MKKVGGVRITMERVGALSSPLCAGCGKPHAECIEWWERELKITGFQADTGKNSEYAGNVRKIQAARARGLDPFCFMADLKAMGYTPHWTPHMPQGSFVPTPANTGNSSDLPTGGTTDGASAGGGTGPTRRGRNVTGGSGRRGKRKPVRRKR